METTIEEGQAFKAKVASWAKNQFNAAVVNRNELFGGKTAVGPFEVDIVLWTKGGILSDRKVIWIECKDRKASIKGDDINKFAESARDVKKAVKPYSVFRFSDKSGEEWDHLVFVSTAQFDADAIKFAKEHKIACYYYDGIIFQEIVKFKRRWLLRY
jgi:hypothetical protein